MSKSIKFKDNVFIDSTGIVHNRSKLSTILSQLSLVAYPVGSIYMSVNSTSPATLFGGTWEAIGQGRCLVGVGTPTANTTNYFGSLNAGSSMTFYNGEQGGQYYHQLTSDEMPKHAHNVMAINKSDQGYAPQNWNNANFSLSYNGNAFYSADTKGWNNAIAMNSTGDSQQHNNMPPYLSVYMWKRTA